MNHKLDLQSTDITSLNIEKIATLFPNCVTETADGKKIDFDLLKQELSNEIVEGNKERYRLEWPGKREAIVTANIPTTNTLRPVREDSVDFDTTENIYIEGDNLEVLKLLQESYLNKIKMIYIDPPYNTGKDFVYKDNFTKDGEEELFESGQKDEYNQRLVANPVTNGRYHSDWLSMMYPRLKLARNLLTEDGVIFISIDDNEVHNLRKICDEIFGEGNFIANIVWQKKYGPANDAQGMSATHEHILLYAKNALEWSPILLKRDEKQLSAYKNPDNDPRGVWRASDLSVRTFSENCYFSITGPDGQVHWPPESTSWRVSETKFKELLNDKRITFGVAGTARPMQKKFLTEVKDGITPQTWWHREFAADTKIARYEMKDLIPENIFDTPKPSLLIKRCIEISAKDGIILDFFSGSATTAHAVMQFNAEEASAGLAQVGKRKYIMVQVPELTSEKSQANKVGYKNICEIGKERIRRAANKIKEEKIEKAKKDGLFSDFKDEQDYGFRVYRLDSSNMHDVYYKPQDYNQGTLDLFADNVKEGRTAEDLLTQVMLDWGLPLSLPIERKTVSSKEVYAVAGDSLYCCFDDGIDEDFAKEIAKEKPLRIVFIDKGFKDDTAKENVKQLLKQLSGGTEMRVI
ncbi:site-specific DNA-methyltransferase [Chryseobacterium oryzae]|uniref:site-specific DNA-methyltransferase (adenine-specific) n=1 Tax=Chryseobacterium oryzae TaxID=2929799 RepID=A0ABY4BE85_9FLAO|nr:site-specific DNA-methyltransferase [Chryseobacterium oryzae]UOE37473.1 site-specific DNA-methyltransferase [Chryseobacterium oryzae]